MKRRNFIKSVAISSIAVSAAPAAAVSSSEGDRGKGFRSKSFALEEATLTQLQEGLHTGRFTSQALVEKYFDRIGKLDKRGPALNSVIELNPEAPAIAAQLDAERKTKGPRSPLHGIPVLVKDNIDTHDRMHTSAGSLALKDSIPARDAFLVRRLREAGMVILGKTNLSEWANFRSSNSTSGWSGRGGLTRNPYVLDRNPCGSSSGSAVAVAASLCPVAVGTETDGSIVSPASACGIVGIKPTVGLVSRAGVIPISHTQDTAGPMARTVADAAALLCVLAGVDPEDPATAAGRDQIQADYTRFLDARGLAGTRIGVARKMFGFHPLVDPLMENALSALKQQGAALIDLPDAFAEDLWDAELEVLLYEFKHDLNAYLARLAPAIPVHSLKELIAFNEQHKKEEMPFFGQDLFIKAEAKGPLSEVAYQKALAKTHGGTRFFGIDAVTAQHKLDAVAAPTMGPVCVTDLLCGDRFSGGSSGIAAMAGYPHITVPAGYVHGLPIGLSFFGPAWSEPVLIKLAYSYEQATKERRPPRFLPTIEL